MAHPARQIAVPHDAPQRLEEERIRQAYARRAASAKSYSRFDPAHLFLTQEVERQLLALLGRHGRTRLDGSRILEIGCGNGHWLREFVKWGARPENLAGVDLLPDRIAQACRLSPPGISFRSGSAAELEFADASFDMVFQATVFTSILDASVKRKIAAEMRRVSRPDGLILWYDFRFNNPRNPDVRGIGKAEIEELFPNCRIALSRVTLAPPLARAIVPRSWLAAELLAAIPWTRTHYLGAIQKRD